MRPLPLTVRKNSRAKRVVVKLIPGAGLQVTVPPGFHMGLLPGLLEEKRSWITTTAKNMLKEGRSPWKTRISIPEHIEFHAIETRHRICRVVNDCRPRLTTNASNIILSGPAEAESNLLDLLREFVRTTARSTLPPLLREMSDRTGMDFVSVTIRNQRSRWGSCSANGRINLNCKALFLPPELLEQLMLHELCHLRHQDHSPRYWALVERHQPDFRNLEDRLRDGMRFVPDWMQENRDENEGLVFDIL